MDNKYAVNGYFTAAELLEIEQLCCFLQGLKMQVDDFTVHTEDNDPLGVISWFGEIGKYVFIPNAGLGTD